MKHNARDLKAALEAQFQGQKFALAQVERWLLGEDEAPWSVALALEKLCPGLRAQATSGVLRPEAAFQPDLLAELPVAKRPPAVVVGKAEKIQYDPKTKQLVIPPAVAAEFERRYGERLVLAEQFGAMVQWYEQNKAQRAIKNWSSFARNWLERAVNGDSARTTEHQVDLMERLHQIGMKERG